MSVVRWHRETIGQKTIEALQRNGFDAEYVEGRDEATERALRFITPGATVGSGGSMTLEQDLAFHARVAGRGGRVIEFPGFEAGPEAVAAAMRQALTCDVFYASANAITQNGFLVNIDGAGNRVAALTFGPKKAVVVAGINKVVRDEAAAWERLQGKVAPMNMKRLDLPNPCTRTGYCVDCKTDTRGCRIYHVLRRRPLLSDLTVILVGEELGF